MKATDIESYLTMGMNLVPVTIAIPYYKKLDLISKSFWFYMLVSFIFSVVGYLLYLSHNLSHYFYEVFTILEGLYLPWLVWKLTQNKKLKVLSLTSAVLIFLSFVYYILMNDPSYRVETQFENFRSPILILILILMTTELALKSDIDLLESYKFWFVFSIFFNISLLSLHFCVENWVLKDNVYASSYSIHLLFIVNIITYLMITKGFLCYRQHQTLFGSSHSRP